MDPRCCGGGGKDFRGDEGRKCPRSRESGNPSLRALAFVLVLLAAPPPARAHAFLDHASPPVGSTLGRAPEGVTIWFTQELEPAFSSISVVDQNGACVDTGDAQVDGKDATILHVSLKPLPPGSYKVIWRVVSVDTHPTDGTFTFRVTR
jgi:methionine-rich copper-binding protein CopC